MGVSQLQLRVSRYTVQLGPKDPAVLKTLRRINSLSPY